MITKNKLILIAFFLLFQFSIFPQDPCLNDTRIPSYNPAVGRLCNSSGNPIGTCWIAPNGKLVTASHVAHGNPLDLQVQFNVYDTSPTPLQVNTYQVVSWQSSIYVPGDEGNDWAVFEVSATNEQTPIQRQNAYLKITRDIDLSTLGTIRITGHGGDSPNTPPDYHKLQQTATGSKYSGSGQGKLIYKVYSTLGVSGSPMIDNETGYAVGILSAGVCIENYGIISAGTSIFNSGFWNALGLETSVLTDQKREDNSRLSNSNIGRWKRFSHSFENNTIINQSLPFTFILGDEEVLQGYQNLVQNPDEKYNRWIIQIADDPDIRNHHIFKVDESVGFLTSRFKKTYTGITIKNNLEATGLDGGNVRFKDPWLVDYADPLYANTKRNRGMDNEGLDKLEFKNQTSPFVPNTANYNGDVYNGLFLNQSGPVNNWQGSYYSVGSPTEQTITVNGQSRKFFPFNWEGTGATIQYSNYFQTGIVFNSSNAVATGILKGQLMSNSTTGISSNSQRKMVRTDNGIYHVVYESMGSVFYTYSLTSNFYGEWAADQLILDHAKNPAIEYDGNIVKAVCEYYDPAYPAYSTNVDLYLLTFTQEANGKYKISDAEVFATCSSSYFGSAKPVIAYNNGQIFVAYRKNSTEGLKERTKWYYWSEERTIPETDANSINPAVAEKPGHIHIAFESLSTIKYKYGFIMDTRWNYDPVVNLSTGSGFNQNVNPSISLSTGTTTYVMVSWLGVYTNIAEKILPKEQDLYRRYAAVSKVGSGTGWGGFSNFSNNVNYTNNNSLNTSAGSILSWSESNGLYSKYVKRRSNGTYDPFTSLSSNGIQTLVSNGSGFDNIKAMVFNSLTSVPYLLNKCTNDFSDIPLAKVVETETIDISYGRSGVVEKSGVEFLFNIGDVLLNDQTINFVVRVDTLPAANLEEFNSAARTESFSLNTQSELIFSNYYYVVNKDKADSVLTDQFNVTFKCELVNAATNQVVGTFDNVTYNKLNVQKYDNQSYLIDCSGIETGNYYLKLTTAVNDSVNLFISDIQRDDILLEKSSLLVRNFKGEGIPTVYDLAQNYPNPFNPSTTIRYQIPQNGMVTLKIYDILGSEVATLVNEEKVAGKYEVNFSASNLASGVYIYKLTAGSFISSKKMLMLK